MHIEDYLGLFLIPEEEKKIYKSNRIDSHKKQLKNLKKVYGLGRSESEVKLADGYTDRAQKRRDVVGSQNPHEKTQAASVNEYDKIILNTVCNTK